MADKRITRYVPHRSEIRPNEQVLLSVRNRGTPGAPVYKDGVLQPDMTFYNNQGVPIPVDITITDNGDYLMEERSAQTSNQSTIPNEADQFRDWARLFETWVGPGLSDEVYSDFGDAIRHLAEGWSSEEQMHGDIRGLFESEILHWLVCGCSDPGCRWFRGLGRYGTQL